MTASRISFNIAILIAIIGMFWGIAMAISQNHITSPGHAHLNLLGWISLFLMGLYYRVHPDLDISRAAIIQAIVWGVGSAGIGAGVGLLYLGFPWAEPLTAISSLVLLADMILFGWLALWSQKTLTNTTAAKLV